MTADSPSGIRSLTPYFTLNGHSQNPRRQTLNPLTSTKIGPQCVLVWDFSQIEVDG